MSDLKFFLWNNPSYSSTKSKYNNKVLQLKEWPDFGFVGCPKEYIILSAYLMKAPIDYKQLKKISSCNEEVINHFIYVCSMLKIIESYDCQRSTVKAKMLSTLSSGLSVKLKRFFF